MAIEILSPEDRFCGMQEKIGDYLRFGVRWVWVIDPLTRRAWVHTSDGMKEAKDEILRMNDPAVELPLLEIFAAIDAP